MFKITYKDSTETFSFSVDTLTQTFRVAKGYVTETQYTVLYQLRLSKAHGDIELGQLRRIEKVLSNEKNPQNTYYIIGSDYEVVVDKP